MRFQKNNIGERTGAVDEAGILKASQPGEWPTSTVGETTASPGFATDARRC
jgi:hypothetical protein